MIATNTATAVHRAIAAEQKRDKYEQALRMILLTKTIHETKWIAGEALREESKD